MSPLISSTSTIINDMIKTILYENTIKLNDNTLTTHKDWDIQTEKFYYQIGFQKNFSSIRQMRNSTWKKLSTPPPPLR